MTERLSYRTLQRLVAACVLVHNLEEALTIAAYAPEVRRRFSGLLPAPLLAATEDLSWFYLALVGATVVPAVVVLVATTGRPSRGKAWAVVFVQAVFLVNVFVPHIPAALALGGYAPGLITAVGINLPYSVYFLRRSVREGAVGRTGVLLAMAMAALGVVVGLGTLYAVVGSRV